METIMNYLDNMFATLPKSGRMLKLKEEMLATMEEKYAELKRAGKSENEAVGIVISEFGNIDELMQELGVVRDEEAEAGPIIGADEADSYLAFKKRAGLLVGLGVALCLAGVSLLVLMTGLQRNDAFWESLSGNRGTMIGLIAMFALLVPAIGMFVYSGLKSSSYEYLRSEFYMPPELRASLRQRQQAFLPTYTFALIVGVCLCVLSPVWLLIGTLLYENASAYGVVVMLLMIAAAVFLFVYSGNIKEGYSVLLQVGSFSKEQKESNRVIGAVASIVWPLATCVYLISGFLYGQWHINWIVFPITAVLFGMFSAVYNVLKGEPGRRR